MSAGKSLQPGTLDPKHGRALRCSVLAGALIIAATCALRAEERSHTFGSLTLAIDDTIWRVVTDGDRSWMLTPVEARRHDYPAIRLTREKLEEPATCREIAAKSLSTGPYAEPKSLQVVVAGIRAVRLEAQTRCRNATPLGIVVCIPHAGWAHVLAATIKACRMAADPFVRRDAVDRLLTGARRAEP